MIDLTNYIKDESKGKREAEPSVSLRIEGKIYFNRSLINLLNIKREEPTYAQFFISADKRRMAVKFFATKQTSCRKIGMGSVLSTSIGSFLKENNIQLENHYKTKKIEIDNINRTIAFELPN